MGLQPKINGKTVERAYEDYRNGIYLVNRRYQRKLVWNIGENEAWMIGQALWYMKSCHFFTVVIFIDI